MGGGEEHSCRGAKYLGGREKKKILRGAIKFMGGVQNFFWRGAPPGGDLILGGQIFLGEGKRVNFYGCDKFSGRGKEHFFLGGATRGGGNIFRGG